MSPQRQPRAYFPRAVEWRPGFFLRLGMAAWLVVSVGTARAVDSPEFVSARVALALAHDDFATAGQLLDAGLRGAPTHPTLLAQRAQLEARRGRTTGAAWNPGFTTAAVRPVAVAAAAAEANADQRLRQARALVGQGRLSSAAEIYRAVLRSAPNDGEARTALGNTYFWRGNWREAQREFTTALAGNSQHLPARIGYLRALHAAGRATAAYQQASELDRALPGDPEVGLLLAGFLAEVDADDQLPALLARPSNDPDVLRRQTALRAQRFIARGRPAEGLALLDMVLGARPRQYDALTDLAEGHINAGRYAQARPFYEQAAALAPQRPEAALGLARVAFLLGRHAEAGQLFQQAADANPESLQAWLGVARIAHIRGDRQRAWEAINTAARLAPGSAHVHEAAALLAFQLDDRAAFETAVSTWAKDQPADLRPDLWAQKWNSTHGLATDVQVLNALLDPLAPETSSEALKLLRQHSAEPRGTLVNRVPPAPTAELNAAAQAKLSKQLTLLQPARIGYAVGFEASSLSDRTGAGASLPSWNEAYVAGFWGQPLGHTVSLDVRRYERFDLQAWSFLPGWSYEFNPQWSVRLNGGGAASGTFIPQWRIGAGATYNFTPSVSGTLDFNYFSFVDAHSFQLAPGLSWQWHPQWSSSVKVYATRNSLDLGTTTQSFSGAFGTTWQFHPRVAVQGSYTVGGEDATNPVRNLIGEQGFQSVGVELKLGLTDHLSLAPLYRYETHESFDLHAFGVGLQWRY